MYIALWRRFAACFYCTLITAAFISTCLFYLPKPNPTVPCSDLPEGTTDVNNDSVVPNIVHFVKLGNAPLSFVEVVCVRAAWLQQNPEVLMIHCDDCSAITQSPNWRHIKDIPRLTLKHVERPQTIFGVKVSWIQHAADIVRIRVLRRYGGIYLDSDAYLVKSMDKYRGCETAIGWPPGQNMGNQIIVAHKRSKFLRLYYELYRRYRPDLWYYNAGQLPTRDILEKKPHLVCGVPSDFGVHEGIARVLFEQCNGEWRNFTAVHAFFRHRAHYCPSDKFGPIDFEAVGRYSANFGQMARLVLSGSTKLGESAVKNITLLRADRLDYSLGCR
ncbi:uncharacterized protein LOC144126220 [Amblyomma americanum]